MSEVMGCAPAGSSVLPMEQCRPLLIPQAKSLKERLLPLALAVRAPGGMTSDTTARVSVFSATSALSLHTLVAMAQRLGSETFMRFICCRTLDPLVSAVFMLMVEDGWPRGMDLMTALRSEPMPRISVTTTGSQLVCCEGRLPMCGPLRSSTTVAQVATSSDRSVQLAHWMAACMFFSGLSMPALCSRRAKMSRRRRRDQSMPVVLGFSLTMTGWPPWHHPTHPAQSDPCSTQALGRGGTGT
jgi:hypothetical protein